MNTKIEIRRGSKLLYSTPFLLDIPVITESFVQDNIRAILDTIQSIFENSAGMHGYQLIYTVFLKQIY